MSLSVLGKHFRTHPVFDLLGRHQFDEPVVVLGALVDGSEGGPEADLDDTTHLLSAFLKLDILVPERVFANLNFRPYAAPLKCLYVGGSSAVTPFRKVSRCAGSRATGADFRSRIENWT